MNRRGFLGSLVGMMMAAPLAIAGLAPSRKKFVDGQWRFFRSVNGVATVNGKPWRNPWLKMFFEADGTFSVRLENFDGEAMKTEFAWWQAWEPKDGSGPAICETRFRCVLDTDSVKSIE